MKDRQKIVFYYLLLGDVMPVTGSLDLRGVATLSVEKMQVRKPIT